MKKINAFKRLEEAWSAHLPAEVELQVCCQVRNATAAGRMADIFLPNALRIAAHLVGGGAPQVYACLPPGSSWAADTVDWRRPPDHR